MGQLLGPPGHPEGTPPHLRKWQLLYGEGFRSRADGDVSCPRWRACARPQLVSALPPLPVPLWEWVFWAGGRRLTDRLRHKSKEVLGCGRGYWWVRVGWGEAQSRPLGGTGGTHVLGPSPSLPTQRSGSGHYRLTRLEAQFYCFLAP